MTYFITSVSVPEPLSQAAWIITSKMSNYPQVTNLGYISVDSSSLSAYGMYWAKVIYLRDGKYLLAKSENDIETVSPKEYSDFIHNNVIQPLTDDEAFFQMMNGSEWCGASEGKGRLLGYIKDIGNKSTFKDSRMNSICPVFADQSSPSYQAHIFYTRYVHRLMII